MTPSQNPNPEPKPEATPAEPIVPTAVEPEKVAEIPVAPVPKIEEAQIVEPKETVAETPPIEPVKEETKKEDKGITVRADETGDKVYWVKDNKRYWVRNPETLKKLGFNLGQEKRIVFDELLKYPEGEPLDLTAPGMTVKKATEAKPEPAVPEPNEPHKIWS